MSDLFDYAPRGTTSEEVEIALEKSHQSVSARRTELRQHGYTDYLWSDGQRVTRPTRSRRQAYVEIATQKGRETIAYGLPIVTNGGDPTAWHHGGNAMSRRAFRETNLTQLRRDVLVCMVKRS